MSWKLPKKYDTSFRVSSLRADEIFRLPAAGTQGACNDRMINAVIEQTRYLLRYTIEKKINKINTQSPSQSAPDKVLAAYKVAIPLLGVAKKDLQADKIVLSFDSQLQLKYFKGEFQYDCNVVGLADPDCEENYVRALAALSKSPDTYPLGNLACNDELFQWEPVLSDYYAGWYSIPQWGIRYSVSKDEVAKTPGWDPANGPCGEHLPGEGEILGFVRPDLEMIILCESMWHLPHQDLDRLQDELKDLPSGTSVDELLTPAGAFLHEMMHFVEQRVIDVIGADGKHAYGFDSCTKLTNDKKHTNADNYQVFSTASYLDQIDWSSGSKPISSGLATAGHEDEDFQSPLWQDL